MRPQKEQLMTIKIEKSKDKTQVIILSIDGNLDASNFQDVIETAKQASANGAQYLLIDMSGVKFMSSSGIVALHSVALLMDGAEPPDLENGWEAFHALDRNRKNGLQPRVKLLNPQPKVQRSLEITGMTEFFEIHSDLAIAIASFS